MNMNRDWFFKVCGTIEFLAKKTRRTASQMVSRALNIVDMTAPVSQL